MQTHRGESDKRYCLARLEHGLLGDLLLVFMDIVNAAAG